MSFTESWIATLTAWIRGGSAEPSGGEVMSSFL
jgi:hypothetical protein